MPGMLDAMKHDPREIREGLKEILAGQPSPATARAIRDALALIATMQADLRRQNLTEYDDKDPE